MPATSLSVAILQPGYLPWLGFFDQLYRADIFIYYDDVQFDNNGWRNRNRIKTGGRAQWLTVPVIHRFGQLVHEVRIDNSQPWARKHLRCIEQSYSRAPHLDRCLPLLSEILSARWEFLVDLDLAMTDLMARRLGIDTPTMRSSELGIEGGKSERLLQICRYFNAGHYYSGAAAKAYLDVALFERNGVKVVWQDYRHPVYAQGKFPFLSHLSALDLILHHGESAGEILMSESEGRCRT